MGSEMCIRDRDNTVVIDGYKLPSGVSYKRTPLVVVAFTDGKVTGT